MAAKNLQCQFTEQPQKLEHLQWRLLDKPLWMPRDPRVGGWERKREKQGSCPAVRKNKLAQTWPCRAAIHAVLGTTWQASHTETGVHGHPCLAIGCPNTLVHFTCAELVQLSFLPHLAGRTSWASIQPCSLHHTSQIPIKPKTTFQT